jgi:hypothetical protein
MMNFGLNMVSDPKWLKVWPELLLLSTKQLNRVTKMDENSF